MTTNHQLSLSLRSSTSDWQPIGPAFFQCGQSAPSACGHRGGGRYSEPSGQRAAPLAFAVLGQVPASPSIRYRPLWETREGFDTGRAATLNKRSAVSRDSELPLRSAIEPASRSEFADYFASAQAVHPDACP